MSLMDNLLNSPLISNLGWTLLHFVWQGALVGLAYMIARRFLRTAKPTTRYLFALTALALLAVLPVITFLHLDALPAAMSSHAMHTSQANHSGTIFSDTLTQRLQILIQPLVPWAVPLWCIGVILMALRALDGWKRATTLAASASISQLSTWQTKVNDVAIRLGITRVVPIAISTKIAVPCAIGWLKPIILIPPSAITGLSPTQLEMVLAHELAHILRHDYLVNLVQLAIETILFYHPVVRYISRDVRRVRELCCDDLAVSTCGDALDYARALTELADLHHHAPAVAMGLDGGGELLARVDRLICPTFPVFHARQNRNWFVSAIAAGLILAVALSITHTRQAGGSFAAISNRNTPTRTAASTSRKQNNMSEVRSAQPHIQMTSVNTNIAATRSAQPVAVKDSNLNIGGSMKISLSEPVAATRSPKVSPTKIIPTQKNPVITNMPATDGEQIQQNAQGPLKVIRMHNFDTSSNTQPQHGDNRNHAYCQPITGSRICSQY